MDQGVPAWTVTNVQPDTYWDASGRPTEGVRTHFRTAAGHHGHVVHPADQFDPDVVAKDVHEAAMKMLAVSDLKGPVVYNDQSAGLQPLPPADQFGT